MLKRRERSEHILFRILSDDTGIPEAELEGETQKKQV